MGWFLTLQGFRNKEIGSFRRSIAWDIFGPKAHATFRAWDLVYDGRDGGTLYIEDDEFVTGLSIEKPKDAAVVDLFELGQRVHCAIHKDERFFITRPEFFGDLPDYLLAALPVPPRLISNVEELFQGLQESDAAWRGSAR